MNLAFWKDKFREIERKSKRGSVYVYAQLRHVSKRIHILQLLSTTNCTVLSFSCALLRTFIRKHFILITRLLSLHAFSYLCIVVLVYKFICERPCSFIRILTQHTRTHTQSYIQQAGGWNISGPFDVKKWDLQSSLQIYHNQYNRGGLFSWAVGADERNSTRNIIQLDQGGLGLPSRDYYLNKTDKNVSCHCKRIQQLLLLLLLLFIVFVFILIFF